MRTWLAYLLAACAVCAALFTAPLAAAPVITKLDALDPVTNASLGPFITAGGPNFTLVITGTGFLQPSGGAAFSLVQWIPPAGAISVLSPTVNVTGTELRVTVPANLITKAATINIKVINADGAVSAPALFGVMGQLAITSGPVLPNGRVSVPYGPLTLAAVGGSPPYVWSVQAGGIPPGLGISPAGVLSGTPQALGQFGFIVTVTDSGMRVASRQLTITIDPPPLLITKTTLRTGKKNAPYSDVITISGGLPPYLFVSDVLPASLELDPGNGTLFGVPSEVGVFAFTVTVTDISGQSVSRTFSVDIISDLSPVGIQTAATLPPGIKDEAYAVTLMVTGGVEPYNWFVASGSLPPGLSLDATGAISGTPTQVGVSVFTAEVFDSLGRGTQRTFTLEIRNAILVITTTSPLPDGAVGSELKITFAATGGAQPYTWSLNGGALPTGTTLAATGELTGIPTATGGFTFTIQVSEAAKATLRKNFSITIKPPLLDITTGATLRAGSEGSFYSVAFAAEGGSQPYRWDAAGAPAGLNMNATTGVLSGTAGTAGTVDFSVQVADKSGTSQTKIFSVSLEKKLAVTTAALPPGSVGVLYAQQVGAGGGAPPYAWSVANGTLPVGLALSFEGAIIGTPSAYGTANFTLQVTDSSGLAARQDYALVINPGRLAVITGDLPNALAGRPYSQTLQASGGIAPYTWSGQTLPPGLSLNSATGTLSGTPSALGTFGFAAQVQDQSGGSESRLFRLTVGAPTAPNVVISGLPETAEPASQPAFQVSLEGAYPVALSGRAILTFASESGRDDPAVQFSTGGRSASFSIPAGSVTAIFSTPGIAIQTGTVAGVITMEVRLQAGTADVTPSPAPRRNVAINPAAPVISSARLVRTGSGFEMQVIGFSTPLSVTQATFRFGQGSDATAGTDLTVPVSEIFNRWYQSPGSLEFGSRFTFIQPFVIQGDSNSVRSIIVTLTNQQGNSRPVTATVQ